MRSQIVMFGDSITQASFSYGGWGGALANTYVKKADIMNRGHAGFSTQWALGLLSFLFPLEHPIPYVGATVFFGANDAALPGRRAGEKHVPLDKYKENLKTIIQHFKKCSPSIKIVLVTPPPMVEEGRFDYYKCTGKSITEPERMNNVTGLYAKKCVELANELGLPSVNLWTKFQETKEWQKKLILSDGLHPTIEGNAVIFHEIVKAFNETGLNAKDMPFDSPPKKMATQPPAASPI